MNVVNSIFTIIYLNAVFTYIFYIKWSVCYYINVCNMFYVSWTDLLNVKIIKIGYKTTVTRRRLNCIVWVIMYRFELKQHISLFIYAFKNNKMLVYDFWQIIECNVKNICVDNHCCYRFDNFIIQVVILCLTVHNKIIRGKYVNQNRLEIKCRI